MSGIESCRKSLLYLICDFCKGKILVTFGKFLITKWTKIKNKNLAKVTTANK